MKNETLKSLLHGVVALSAEAGSGGVRLDTWIPARMAGVSRAQAQRWIEGGRVTVGGRTQLKAAHLLRPGDEVVVDVPPPIVPRAAPENIPVTIFFEDGDLCVIDKPAGLVVHPSQGHAGGTLVNALLFHVKDLSSVGGELKPGIVHRGLMLVSKSDRCHRALQGQFAARAVKKTYLAIVYGAPGADEGLFDTPYGRNPRDRKKFSSKVAEGKRAITGWKVLARFRGAALVECDLQTGRTHQIRVHFADAGMPLLGDLQYGAARRARGLPPKAAALVEQLDRVMLHAVRISFSHPVTGAALSFRAPVPPEMQAVIDALKAGT